MVSEFRHLPGVDAVLGHERLHSVVEEYPHDLLVDVVRKRIEQARRDIAAGSLCPSLDEVAESVYRGIGDLVQSPLRAVINATGVILHTNIGRAPLSPEAIRAMDAVSGYCNLEFDLEAGTRGSRHVHIEPLLCQLTGAEAALVVNNNASAVLLGLTALAKRKEVIVSRGEAVEIGGGFRIPDVMRQSGAKLVEVGTTNCTYVADYEQAVTARTVALMRVHSSNFKVVGFTHAVALEEVVALARQKSVVVLDDLGSGCFLDTGRFGLDHEPMVQESVAGGADLVFFSGDKLVGGPQAGIVVGKKSLVEVLKRHPLARAVRIDKSRLGGLRATLAHYLKGEATARVPVWRMISAPIEEIERRAAGWAQAIPDRAIVIPGDAMVGGGSLPGGTLPTRLLAIMGKKISVQKLAQRLRLRETPVIGRIEDDVLLLDPRTVLPEEDGAVIEALKEALGNMQA